MDLRLALYIIAGCILGESMRYITRRLLQNRTAQPVQNPALTSRWSHFIWAAAGAGLCAAVCVFVPELLRGVQIVGSILILASIAIIDNSVRKIPNELIAALVILKAVTAIVGGDPASLIPAAIGMAAGFVLFLIPSRFGVYIGWGDIKFAAVAGFCLGIIGILQATLIMSAALVVYLLYLNITKKGNWKTKVAIGPSLSLGIGITLLFPLALAIL